MDIALIVFMVLAGLVSIFTMIVVIRDLVKERKAEKEAQAAKEAAANYIPEEEPLPMDEAPVAEPMVAASPVADELSITANLVAPPQTNTVQLNENSVVFSVGDAQRTLDEKFQDLTPEQQRYYVDIVQYAMGQEGAKQFKNSRYEEYKIGKTRLVRMQIRRGVVICEFILLNSDFNNFIRDNKVHVKQAPTVLRVEDEGAVEIAKNSIDIAVRAATDEIEYQKERRRERRRLARMQKSAQEEQE